jgi:excisionase family DNA binding protein
MLSHMLLQHPEDGITVPQAAEQIGVDAQTVRHWVKTGKLPATRWGPEGARMIRIDPADLEGLGPRLVVPTDLDGK